MRNGRLIALIAETHIHVGQGQSAAEIDQPIAREKATRIPFIPGQGIKGAVSSRFEPETPWSDEMFGKSSTDVGIGRFNPAEARLLLLPLRAQGAPFVLATSADRLVRLSRDLCSIGRGDCAAHIDPPNAPLRTMLAGLRGSAALLPPGVRTIEEFRFDTDNPSIIKIQKAREFYAKALTQILALPDYLDLDNRLAILGDQEFRLLAEVGPPVRARNQLNDNKTSNNLWYEETLPPDTIMTSVIVERSQKSWLDSRKDGAVAEPGPTDQVLDLLGRAQGRPPYLQIGGNESVGQGWFELIDTLPRPVSDTSDEDEGIQRTEHEK